MAMCFVFGTIGLVFTVVLPLTTLYDYFFKPYLLCRLPIVLEVWIPIALGSGLLFGLGWLLSRHYNRSDVTQLLVAVAQEMPDYVLIVEKKVTRKSEPLAGSDA